MDVVLTDDQVKGALRAAVISGVVCGWYRHYPFKGREWVVNPSVGPCVCFDADGIRSYCSMLTAAA